MSTLFILNDSPYGTERCYNALRLARALAERGAAVRVFLMGDAAACAHKGQKVPQGWYNVADMLAAVARRGGEIAACGTCLDARGIGPEQLIEASRRGTLDELAEWTKAAEKVIVF
ncbi:MAG: DsrE family protein [Burkholderiales bacterium]|nr:DsrE family protein [Burkholderiales bacterium]